MTTYILWGINNMMTVNPKMTENQENLKHENNLFYSFS